MRTSMSPAAQRVNALAAFHRKKFWSLVDRSNDGGCWPWMGPKAKNGYGLFTLAGRSQTAHRYSWYLAHNQTYTWVRDQVHHTCHNRACVNPAHLQLIGASDHAKLHWSERNSQQEDQ